MGSREPVEGTSSPEAEAFFVNGENVAINSSGQRGGGIAQWTPKCATDYLIAMPIQMEN